MNGIVPIEPFPKQALHRRFSCRMPLGKLCFHADMDDCMRLWPPRALLCQRVRLPHDVDPLEFTQREPFAGSGATAGSYFTAQPYCPPNPELSGEGLGALPNPSMRPRL